MQKELDEAKAGQPASKDREKLLNQMNQQMGIASDWKEKAAQLQQIIDKMGVGDREKLLSQLQAAISNADEHKERAKLLQE